MSAQELTRQVASLAYSDWEKLIRLGRHLKLRPRRLNWYRFQDPPEVVEMRSERGWVGCRRTRRSTTVASLGTHLINM